MWQASSLSASAPSTGIDQQGDLDESRPTDAALQRRFNWDDSKAAEATGFIKASTLSRSIVVIREDGGIEHRAYSAGHEKTTT